MSEILRADLLERMRHARMDLEGMFRAFDEVDAAKVGVTEKWSVHDLCAHMVGWQEEFLRQADSLAGPFPEKPECDVEEINAASVKARAGQPWNQVREAWLITLRNIAHHVQGAAPERLEMGQLYRGFLEGIALTHMFEHLGQMNAWMKKLGIQALD